MTADSSLDSTLSFSNNQTVNQSGSYNVCYMDSWPRGFPTTASRKVLWEKKGKKDEKTIEKMPLVWQGGL